MRDETPVSELHPCVARGPVSALRSSHMSHGLRKFGAYTMAFSINLVKIQCLNVFKLPFLNSEENQSLNKHRGLNEQLRPESQKRSLNECKAEA